MAKRKTPKTVDLKPQAEKITDQQLERLQGIVSNINRAQMDLGSIEVQKHSLLHTVADLQAMVKEMHVSFKKEYGDVVDIDIKDGRIKYNENGSDETNSKDNNR